MGFRCPMCGKEFYTDKEAFMEHLMEENAGSQPTSHDKKQYEPADITKENRFEEIKAHLSRLHNARYEVNTESHRFFAFTIIDDRGKFGKINTDYIVEVVPSDEKQEKGVVHTTIKWYDVETREDPKQVYHLHCSTDDYCDIFWCYNEQHVIDKIRWFRQKVR